MSFEIEKKYFVGDFNDTLTKLKQEFGKYKIETKYGFWWCGNHSGIENVLDLSQFLVNKKEVQIIKDIGEVLIPEQDFQYVRLRIKGKGYFITFKTKSLVNNIEQNTEYEFEVDLDKFKRVISYLESNLLIFYYNIKKSWKFKSADILIELSKFNDLKDAYLEIELTGSDKDQLTDKLEQELLRFKDYSLKEENKSYVELSRLENRLSLKGYKLNKYSRDALKELKRTLNES